MLVKKSFYMFFCSCFLAILSNNVQRQMMVSHALLKWNEYTRLQSDYLLADNCLDCVKEKEGNLSGDWWSV